MQNVIEFEVIITDLCSVFLRNIKEIVYYSKQSIGLFFHALSNETIKKLTANVL